MRRFITLALGLALVLLLGAPAWATAGFTNCRAGAISPPRINGPQDLACYEFVLADSTTESGIFFSSAVSMLMCFDPDTASAGVPGDGPPAEVAFMHCPAGVKAATGANTCEPLEIISGAYVTGLAGTAAVQNRCLRVGPGAYYIDVIVAAPTDDTPVVTLQGE